MNPKEIMDVIRAFDGNGIATLSPGPVKIKVADCDKRSFALLEWLKEKYPDATVQDTIDALMAALWWVIFWSSLSDEEAP